MGTKANELQIINIADNQEIDNLQTLTEGCNQVVVSYALEDFTHDGLPKVRKMVVFFDPNFCPLTVNDGINDIMMRHGRSLVKSHHRTFRLGSWIKSSIKFGAALFKDILGIQPDNNEIIDFRDRYENYRYNGRTKL